MDADPQLSLRGALDRVLKRPADYQLFVPDLSQSSAWYCNHDKASPWYVNPWHEFENVMLNDPTATNNNDYTKKTLGWIEKGKEKLLKCAEDELRFEQLIWSLQVL